MNFDLSETQKLFQLTVGRFARTVDVSARRKMRSIPGGYDRVRWVELTELGLLAIAASEEQGGLDGSLTDLSMIAESFGANNALDPWLENGVLPVRLFSEAGKNTVLETLIDGSQIAALAFSEAATRYELFPCNTQALRLQGNNGYSLHGEKQFVMGGSLADLLLVTANNNGEFGLFCIPVDSLGIESRAYRLADGSQATVVTLSQVEIPDSARLDLSYAQFQKVVMEMRVLCCAEMLGLSQLLLDSTLEYVREREQFNAPIGSFQVIQHGLVDCYCELEQMRSLLYRTLLHVDSADDWYANVMGAKSFIAEGANLISRTAVQYHGAMGITEEIVVGHAMKRIIMLTRLFGDISESLKHYVEAA